MGVKFIDINMFRENPEKIFEYHRIISKYPELLDIGIRFTVQVNLFMGSIFMFGKDHHKNILNDKRRFKKISREKIL